MELLLNYHHFGTLRLKTVQKSRRGFLQIQDINEGNILLLPG